MKEIINELRDFAIKGYVELLEYLNTIYEIVPFYGLPKADVPYLVLRHDVDYSLSLALRMAELERKLGIRATYFVLFSDRFYNLHQDRNVQIIRRISSLGHEVGLHYDPSKYRLYANNPERTLKIEISLLEHLLGTKVHSIARHGPWDRDPFYSVKGYINANDPRWRGDLMLHDSCRAWAPFEALSTLFTNPPRRVQLLVHPEYWKDEEIDRRAFVEDFFRNREYENREYRKELEKWWVEDPAVIEYDAWVANSRNSLTQLPNKPELAPSRSEFQQSKELLRWYIINTLIGWKLHKATDAIRSFGSRILG